MSDLENARKLLADALPLKDRGRLEVFRALPQGGWDAPQLLEANDLIVTVGRNYIARRITGGDTVASAMAYMAVGTGTTAATLSDTVLGGEYFRKALTIASAGPTAANVFTAVSTFGGAADSITSLQITEAGIFNHAGSGAGTMMQRVTFAAVTLANSDMLRLTLETNVGSTG